MKYVMVEIDLLMLNSLIMRYLFYYKIHKKIATFINVIFRYKKSTKKILILIHFLPKLLPLKLIENYRSLKK